MASDWPRTFLQPGCFCLALHSNVHSRKHDSLVKPLRFYYSGGHCNIKLYQIYIGAGIIGTVIAPTLYELSGMALQVAWLQYAYDRNIIHGHLRT